MVLILREIITHSTNYTTMWMASTNMQKVLFLVQFVCFIYAPR